jgi:hypothetical protein
LKVLTVSQAAGMNDTLDLIYKIIIQKNNTCTILFLGIVMNGSVGNILENDTLPSKNYPDLLSKFSCKNPFTIKFHAVGLSLPG